MMQRAAILLLTMLAVRATAGWSPAWTNGSIWAHGRLAADLRAAAVERWTVGGWPRGGGGDPSSSTTPTALFESDWGAGYLVPTIWPSARWLYRLDGVISNACQYFVDQRNYSGGTFNDWWGAHATNQWLPTWTWTGLVAYAVTNLRVSAASTNSPIWPRRSDYDQRRRLLQTLSASQADWGWQDGASGYAVPYWGTTVDEAETNVAYTMEAASTIVTNSWAWLEDWAETNWHRTTSGFWPGAYTRKTWSEPGYMYKRRIEAERVQNFVSLAGWTYFFAYPVALQTNWFERRVECYVATWTNLFGAATDPSLMIYNDDTINWNKGQHDMNGDDVPAIAPLRTMAYWTGWTWPRGQVVTWTNVYVVGDAASFPTWAADPPEAGYNRERETTGYTYSEGNEGDAGTIETWNKGPNALDEMQTAVIWWGYEYP